MWNELQKRFKRFETPLTILAGSASLTVLLLNLDFYFLEANLYDLRMSRGFQPKPNSNIALIAIDDATIRELDEFAPLPIEFHTRLLETLEEMQPKAVGYLV